MRLFLLRASILAARITGCILLCSPAHSGDLSQMVGFSAGANAVWFDGDGAEFPADFEGVGNVKASLSPHISSVGSLNYGFTHAYVRWDAGFRVTATDADNPNFNVYLGIRYRGGSTSAVQPSEWAPDAGLGWKPNPEKWPNVILAADASYGLDTADRMAYLGVRYVLPFNPFK